MTSSYRTRILEARAYYALCDQARALGIPIDLDDPASPATVADLQAAVDAKAAA
jgi:hypothetical protein